MIDYQKPDLSRQAEYERIHRAQSERGCEYSFVNLCLWGRQRIAFTMGYVTVFSQYEKRSLYLYPIGKGDIRPVLEAIMADAREKGLICRLTGLMAADCVTLEELYPGKFQFLPDRNSCDYVYNIEDLATLKGKKFQKKRNHLNKFRENHPNCQVFPIDEHNLDAVREMVDRWYVQRLSEDPHADFHLEQRALRRAFAHGKQLGIEGIILVENDEIIAMTMGSPLSENTFDVHFEKAQEDIDGAYPAINQAFAAYLQEKYPTLRYLNREDDMGLPGLRQAKLSYHPDHLVVKFWAQLMEAEDDD